MLGSVRSGWGRGLVLLTSVGLLWCAGCTDKRKKTGTQASTAQPAVPADHPAVADIPFDRDAPDDPARLPQRSDEQPLEVALRYIVVSHEGAPDDASGRSRADAALRARRLAAVLRKRGADFARLASELSEVPEAARGKVETFRQGDADPAFFAGGASIGVGQVADPVHTERGFYVIERVKLEEYSSAHILVMYKGGKLAPPGLQRSKEDAQKRAERVANNAQDGKVSFAVLAGRYSDSPSKIRGGVIAPLRANSLLPGFEPYWEELKRMQVDQVSGVVETPYGFHVIKRLPLDKIQVRHVLVGYTGGETEPREPRTKRAALALAIKARAEAKRPDADFGALAEQYSDGPSGARAGLLPPFARGQMVPRFEQYAFALKVGQVSDVVETKFGYHVIKRER